MNASPRTTANSMRSLVQRTKRSRRCSAYRHARAKGEARYSIATLLFLDILRGIKTSYGSRCSTALFSPLTTRLSLRDSRLRVRLYSAKRTWMKLRWAHRTGNGFYGPVKKSGSFLFARQLVGRFVSCGRRSFYALQQQVLTGWFDS
jgi:hypothetical protein